MKEEHFMYRSAAALEHDVLAFYELFLLKDLLS